MRRAISLLISLYAILFAFGALTAVRWPTIVMVMEWIVKDDLAGGLAAMKWRELGLAHGGAYLLAALCYYISAAFLSTRRPGALAWYGLALAASIPCLFLASFSAGWWRNPSPVEGIIIGLSGGALLLLFAVLELSGAVRKPESAAHAPDGDVAGAEPANAREPVIIYVPQPAEPEPQSLPRRRRQPVLIADAIVARQRASFAAHGRMRRRTRP
jgi:hypothetical protein